MPYTRCSKCDHRRTLPRKPESYLRLPRCRGCGRRMTLDGKPTPGTRQSPSLVARYRVDKYRHQVERAGGRRYQKPCNPGRGGCSGYHFPHRRGSLFCEHNPLLTADDLKARWGH